MSTSLTGELVVRGHRFCIVVGRFNELITEQLRRGAVDTLVRHGCDSAAITEVWVPGAFELPLAARKAAATGRYDAIIALGCVIRGATPHFDHVAAAATRGLADVAMEFTMPVTFGVLTTHTIEQAVERAGTKAGNKGADAALCAIEMVNVLKNIECGGSER